jgi:hypothetical protein
LTMLGTAYVRVLPETSGLTGSSFRSRMARVGKLAGLALAGAFVIESKKAIDTTQDLTKSTISLHKNLGLTNKVASEWANVAKARGADTTKLGMAFKTLATQISSAGHGSQASIDMFKELGFSQADIQRSMTDTEFATKKVADGLNALPAGADKAAFASKLFGRGWQTIAPILRDGSAAMQEQLNTVEKYGGVLEGKTLKGQEDLLATLRENKIAWQGLQVQLATALTPTLIDVSKQFQKITQINADPHLTDEEKWKRISTVLEKDFSHALDVVVKLIPTFAEHVGQAAPQVAGALVKGFLGANVWGKLAIGAFLVSKLGGWAAITAIGSLIGKRIGAGIAVGEAEGIAAGTVVGGAGGAAAGGGAAGGAASRQAPQWLEKLLGGGGAGVAGGAAGGTSIGRLLLTRLGPPAAAAAAVNHYWKQVSDVMEEVPILGKLGDFHGEKVKEEIKGSLKALQPLIDEVSAKPTLGNMSKLADAMHQIGRQARKAGVAVPDVVKHFEHFRGTLAATAAGVHGGSKALKGLEQNLKGISTKTPSEAIDGLKRKYGSLVVAGHDMSQKQRAVFVDMAQVARDKGEITQKQLEQVTNSFGNNTAKWQRMMRRAADATGQSVQSIKRSTHGMTVTVSKDYKGMVLETGHGLQILTSNTDRALRVLGARELHWQAHSAHAVGGGGGHPVGRQEGGLTAMVPGKAPGDRHVLSLNGVPIAGVESLEGIFVGNRNLMAALEKMNAQIPRRLAKGGMAAMIGEANRFEARHFPYAWGGGHGGFGIQPVDCSGAVSDVLHAAGLLKAPMVSGDLAHWGKAGKGPLTVYANPVHTFMSLAGRFFGTSSSNPGGGAGWIQGGFPDSYLSGFAARTMNVAGGMMAALKRVILEGHAGAMKREGQGSLDKTWKAATAYIDSKTPAGAFGGGQGLADFGKGPGKIVGASVYGFGEPGTGTVGASGVSLPGKPAFAELDMGTALGHLPFGKKLGIEVGGKQAVGVKLDIGAGGGSVAGHHRSIDLWRDLAERLGVGGSFLGLAKVKGLQEGGMVDLWGKGLAHLATGGTAPPHHIGQLHRGHGHERRLPRVDARLLHKLERLRHRVGRLDELIDIATRHASFPGSPMGEDMSTGERTGILGLDKRLLANLLDQRHIARTVLGDVRHELHHHPDPHERKFLKREHSRLHQMLTELQGVTGGGGRIFDLREAIAGLAPATTGVSDQAAITQQFFDFLKIMGTKTPFGGTAHEGAVVPGPVGAERWIRAKGGEAIGYAGKPQDPVILADIYIGGEKIDERVEVKIRKHDRAAELRSRAGIARVPG